MLGLSSFGSCESNVLPTLLAVERAASALLRSAEPDSPTGAASRQPSSEAATERQQQSPPQQQQQPTRAAEGRGWGPQGCPEAFYSGVSTLAKRADEGGCGVASSHMVCVAQLMTTTSAQSSGQGRRRGRTPG